MNIGSGNSGTLLGGLSLGSSMRAQEVVTHRSLKTGHQVWV